MLDIIYVFCLLVLVLASFFCTKLNRPMALYALSLWLLFGFLPVFNAQVVSINDAKLYLTDRELVVYSKEYNYRGFIADQHVIDNIDRLKDIKLTITSDFFSNILTNHSWLHHKWPMLYGVELESANP